MPPAMAYGVGVHAAPPRLAARMRRVLRSAWHAPGAATSAWVTSCLLGHQHSDPQAMARYAPIYRWSLLLSRPRSAWRFSATGMG
eukprot:8434763-Pyramimonas_sp.AAC.1